MEHVDIARSLLDVPWEHQGRDPSIGIDCVGLLVLSFKAKQQPADRSYARHPQHGALEARLEYHFGPPVTDDIRVGDVVAMAGSVRSRTVRHVGIIASNESGRLTLIHTDSIVGKVVEHPLDDRWRSMVRAVYRRGVDE